MLLQSALFWIDASENPVQDFTFIMDDFQCPSSNESLICEEIMKFLIGSLC